MKVEVSEGHNTWRLEKNPNWEYVSLYHWGDSANNKWPRLRFKHSEIVWSVNPRIHTALLMQVLRLYAKPGTHVLLCRDNRIEPIDVIVQSAPHW